MSRKQADYLSYLLRLWRDNDAQEASWRASLQSSLTGTRHSFASLNDLFKFLQQQADDNYDADENEDGTQVRQANGESPPSAL